MPHRHEFRQATIHMTDGIDIWRSANLYVKRYGDAASIVAAMQGDWLTKRGEQDDLRASSPWPTKRIERQKMVGGAGLEPTTSWV